MLAIQYIRQEAEAVKQACRDKQLDPEVVDQLLAVDQEKRQLQQAVDDLRRQSNEHAENIKKNIAMGQKPSEEDKEAGKQIKEKLKEIEPKLAEVNEKFTQFLFAIPNPPAVGVPVGKDESGNQVVRQVGQIPQFDFAPKTHDEIMEALDWLDTKRATKIAGFRGYFLKNQGLLLERALLAYAMDLMGKHGFQLLSAPVLVNREAMQGTGYFPWGQEDHYYTQDGQILAGTAEVALTSYYADELLREKDLPIKLCGISPCFRREVGTYGKDTKGVIRVHQFNKVEQVVLTVADETETAQWHEKMVGFAEELLQNLGLSYQVLLMCTGDMGAGQRKKYDLETWFPGQNKYRETHSASYFNDFQARRLNIRYQAADGSVKYVYTLNNTVAASPRLLAAIVENYQQADGSVKIPEVLKPYLVGTEYLTKV
jgi:seryl-tRNA synthetase